MRAGLKMVHRNRNGKQSVDRTTMNVMSLKDIITSKRRPAIVVPGYRFNKDIALFSAVLIAELKQDGDKESLCKMDHLLRRPSSLEKLVSKTFRPIVGNTVHLSNDLEAIQQWCDLHKKNVIVRSLDMNTGTLVNEFDSKTCFDTIELLKTREDGHVYYHVLVNTPAFLKEVKKIIHPMKKEHGPTHVKL